MPVRPHASSPWPALAGAAALASMLAAPPAQAGSWRAVRTLDGPAAAASPPDAPQLSMASSGRGLLAWNVQGVVRYAELLPTGGWTPTRQAPGSGQGADFFGVGVGASGAAAIAWTSVATRYVPARLMFTQRAPGGAFSPSTEPFPGQPAPGRLRVAIACDGGVTLAWQDATAIRAAFRAGSGPSAPGRCDGAPGSGPWTIPVTLSDAGETPAMLEMTGNDAGQVLATWQSGAPGQPSRIVAALRGADGTWEAPGTVSAGTGHPTWLPVPGLDATGDAAIGYLDGPAMTVVRRPAGGAWAAPESLSGAHVATWPALSLAPDGSLLAAWRQEDAGQAGSVWQASAPSVTGAWSASRRLSPRADDAAPPAAAVAGASGPAVVAWVDDATSTVRAAVAAGGPAGAWKVSALGGGWWGGQVPVGAAPGLALAGWAAPYAGNPNAVVILGRPWR